MLSFDPYQQTDRENYKLLIGSVIPRPIAFVTSKSEQGIVNAAPFSYFNLVSSNPPMLSVSVQRQGGQKKDTARNILSGKEFVVHVVDEENVFEINETSASLPPDQSEIDVTKLTLVDSEEVGVPAVVQSKIRFECVLHQAVDLPGADLLIGRIVRIHVDEAIYKEGRINADLLKPVSRLAGTNYAKLGEVFSLKRPD
ncbi:flavin reductase family protein [Planococcus salinarum]|uniref:flavin reductase family protein n=1 Tax=Planococcus salinarum TaxID=622695 RepID=UPI000E3D0CA4|nr:flavin reductase family protein [Planococcus salinarum]TAA72394.1 flavin reductase family protein [Planococcus salinarum]